MTQQKLLSTKRKLWQKLEAKAKSKNVWNSWISVKYSTTIIKTGTQQVTKNHWNQHYCNDEVYSTQMWSYTLNTDIENNNNNNNNNNNAVDTQCFKCLATPDFDFNFFELLTLGIFTTKEKIFFYKKL